MLIAAMSLLALVSFGAPADVAARLLPKLGAAMGIRLEADQRAGKEVLLIRVQGANRDRLLRRVATATGGTWETIAGGYRLRLDGLALAVLRKEETRRRSAWLPAAKVLLSKKSREDALLSRVLDTLPVDTLAGIHIGDRVVWSSAPTPLQKPLPAKAFAAGVGLEEAYRKNLEEISRRPGMIVDDELIRQAALPVKTVLLILRRGYMVDSLGVSLRTYDSAGRSQATMKALLPSPPTAALDFADVPVALPDSVTAWAKAAVDGSASPTLANDLVHPDDREPLALGVGPAIEKVADSLGKDVVAVLPDEAYSVLAAELPRVKRLPDLAGALARGGMRLSVDEQGLLAVPSSPAATVDRRADRHELARLIEWRSNHGGFSVDDLVRPGLLWSLLRTLAPIPRDEEGMELQYFPSKAAWKALTPQEKAAAFGPGLRMETTRGGFWKAMLREYVFSWSETDEPSFGHLLTSEPTAYLSGMKDQGLLRAKLKEDPLALVKRQKEPLAHVEGLWSLSRSILNSPELRSATTRYWPAVNRRIELTATLPIREERMMIATLSETWRTGDRPVFYPALFPRLRQELELVRGGR